MPIRKARTRKQDLHSFQFQLLEPRKVLTSLLATAAESNALISRYDAVDFSSVDYPVDVNNKICFVSGPLNRASASGVVGRSLFYNDSGYDGNDIAATPDDDNALAIDKVAFFPGETATFDNYSNYIHGINGIFIDVFLANPGDFSADHIQLATGTGNELSDYERLDIAPEISVRQGEGVNGSDRISVVLPNGSVVNEFLQVTLLANSTTGLADRDVFYFGNIVGEVGNTAGDSFVNSTDIGLVRSNLSGFFAEEVDNRYDINRDRFVNSSDIGETRNNLSGFFPVPLITAPLEGNDFFVTSASEIEDIIDQVQPGDTITLQDGTWTNQQIQLKGFGTEDRPITLRAQTPGQVILNGNSTLNISGDWLVADGLHFDGGALTEGDHIVEFRGDCGEATNSRLTNSSITNYNPSNINTRYFWVSLYGQNNRVDHNVFSGQNHSGVTVTVWRDDSSADHHLIDNNYFADRPVGNSNGFESIRIGTSDESLSDSFTTVEYNLFEQTDGEIEIISNKSGSNIFRYNTFRESSGTLTLRHGDNNLVEGNFFIGNGKDGSGGVRVIGENQTVVNNYFEGLDGRADGAISISAAVPNSPLNGYYQVRNAVIAHNTIIDVNDAAIIFDHGLGSDSRTLLARDVTIANNLISSSPDTLFTGNEGSNWQWEGNIAFGASLGPKAGDSGITVTNPQLELVDGLWRLAAGSPAIDGANGNYGSFTGGIDIDGQARVGQSDIGADEFSSGAIVRKPLFAADVGHYWGSATSVGGGNGDSGSSSSFLAIQAEDFAAALDPNGDGDTFTTTNTSNALGGTALVAPAGSRVTQPATQQDAVLDYDLVFSEAGTYTAYYRVRGFSGSTDSIYTPSDFGANPEVNTSIPNTGSFAWETGGTFDVSSSEVGNTLDFSIGKRERDAEFDAFVFHLDDSLSASELDALFT